MVAIILSLLSLLCSLVSLYFIKSLSEDRAKIKKECDELRKERDELRRDSNG